LLLFTVLSIRKTDPLTKVHSEDWYGTPPNGLCAYGVILQSSLGLGPKGPSDTPAKYGTSAWNIQWEFWRKKLLRLNKTLINSEGASGEIVLSER
jgi:hypothetical protein